MVNTIPDLSAFCDTFEKMDTPDRVRHILQTFDHDAILTTSFGPTAGVMLKLVTDVLPGIRVITIRHGYETDRTRELIEIYAQRFDFNLKVYDAPRLAVPPDGTSEFAHFKRLVKFETLQYALRCERPRAWLSGIMRGETPERQFFPYARQRGKVLAVYPMLDWSELQAIDYCIAHKLPMNEDYYDPCKGHEQNKECGLHTHSL